MRKIRNIRQKLKEIEHRTRWDFAKLKPVKDARDLDEFLNSGENRPGWNAKVRALIRLEEIVLDSYTKNNQRKNVIRFSLSKGQINELRVFYYFELPTNLRKNFSKYRYKKEKNLSQEERKSKLLSKKW